MTKQRFLSLTSVGLSILLLCLSLAACGQGSSSDTPTDTDTETETQSTQGNTPNTPPTLSVPNFTVEDEDGNSVKLSDFLGQPIVVNFWASWCPPCQAEMPDFQDAYERYGDRVQFVIVNMTDGKEETVDSATVFARERGYTFPLYFDTTGSASKAYHVSSIPCTYFIDANGNPSGDKVGLITSWQLEEEIKKLLE